MAAANEIEEGFWTPELEARGLAPNDPVKQIEKYVF